MSWVCHPDFRFYGMTAYRRAQGATAEFDGRLLFGIQRQTPDERLSRSVPPPPRFRSGLTLALASNKCAQLGQSSDGVAHRQSISGRVGDDIRPLPGPLRLPHCRQHPNFLRRKCRCSALVGGYSGWIGHPEDAPSHNGIVSHAAPPHPAA